MFFVFLFKLVAYPVLLMGMLGSYATLRRRFHKSKCSFLNGCCTSKIWAALIVIVLACCMGNGFPEDSICTLTDLLSLVGYMAFFVVGLKEVHHHRRALRQWFFARTRDDD